MISNQLQGRIEGRESCHGEGHDSKAKQGDRHRCQPAGEPPYKSQLPPASQLTGVHILTKGQTLFLWQLLLDPIVVNLIRVESLLIALYDIAQNHLIAALQQKDIG